MIDRARAQPPGTTIVGPESGPSFHTLAVGRFWQKGLTGLDVTIIAETTELLCRARMPAPGSMWQPWRIWTGDAGDDEDDARAHFFANPVVEGGNAKVAPLICCEQTLVWPGVQSAFHRPGAIVVVGDGWWTAIIDSQKASSTARARLFDLPLVISFNI